MASVENVKPISSWTCDDVNTWLLSFGAGFVNIAKVFHENSINGNDLIHLTDEDLSQDLGIDKKLTRKQILIRIADLTGASRPFSPPSSPMPSHVISPRPLSSDSSNSGSNVSSPPPVLSPQNQIKSVERKSQSVPSTIRAVLHEFKKGDIQYKRKLGEGNFGEAWLATWNGAEIVVKKLKDATSSAVQELKEEAQKLAGVPVHPHVLGLVGFSEEEGALITAYAKNGSVEKTVIERKMFTAYEDTPKVTQIAKDVASGLMHLHSNNVIHRDIAARNIFLDGEFRAKLGDMGLARTLDDDRTYHSVNVQRPRPLRWEAPETLVDNPDYTKASDVYMFGIFLWELFSREVPYLGVSTKDMIQGVKAGDLRPSRLDAKKCPEAIFTLITDCWRHKPEERPTMAEVFIRLSEINMDINYGLYERDVVEEARENVKGSMRTFGQAGNGKGQMSALYGLAYQKQKQRIIVCDQGHAILQVFNREGRFITEVGAKGPGNGQFTMPCQVSIQPSTNFIMVADGLTRDNIQSKVEVFTEDYQPKMTIGRGLLTNASGVDSSATTSEICVSEERSLLHLFSGEGRHIRTFSSQGSRADQTDKVFGLCYDNQRNRLLIADCRNFRICVWDTKGSQHIRNIDISNIEGTSYKPITVYVDPVRDRYFVGTYQAEILVFDSKTDKLVQRIGCQGAEPGQFRSEICGIAVDEDGVMMATDTYQSRVNLFFPVNKPNFGFQYV